MTLIIERFALQCEQWKGIWEFVGTPTPRLYSQEPIEDAEAIGRAILKPVRIVRVRQTTEVIE